MIRAKYRTLRIMKREILALKLATLFIILRIINLRIAIPVQFHRLRQPMRTALNVSYKRLIFLIIVTYTKFALNHNATSLKTTTSFADSS